VFPRQTTFTFYLSAVLLFGGLGAIGWTAGRTHALTKAAPDVAPTQLVWLLFVLPTSMNAAWMSVASCLGLNVLAVSQGLPHDNEVMLAGTLAVIVAAIGAAIVLYYSDIAWGLVLIWAFMAVLNEHQDLMLIKTLSIVAIGVAALCSGYVAIRHWQSRHGQRAAPLAADSAAPAGLQEGLLSAAQGQAGTSGSSAPA